MNITPDVVVWLTGISVTIGGIVTLIVTSFLKRGELKVDEAKEIRLELRAQNASLLVLVDAERARVDLVEREVATWRDKYYALQTSYTTLMGEKETLAQKTIAMQREIDTLTMQVKALQAKAV